MVLDEVDRMVDIGFIQDIRKIMLALPRERQSYSSQLLLLQKSQELFVIFQKSN